MYVCVYILSVFLKHEMTRLKRIKHEIIVMETNSSLWAYNIICWKGYNVCIHVCIKRVRLLLLLSNARFINYIKILPRRSLRRLFIKNDFAVFKESIVYGFSKSRVFESIFVKLSRAHTTVVSTFVQLIHSRYPNTSKSNNVRENKNPYAFLDGFDWIAWIVAWSEQTNRLHRRCRAFETRNELIYIYIHFVLWKPGDLLLFFL